MIKITREGRVPLIGAAALVVVVASISLLSGGSDGPPTGMLFLAAIVGIGGLPIWIAVGRKHHQLGLIVLLTLLGVVPVIGWVTWIVALVVAAAVPVQRQG